MSSAVVPFDEKDETRLVGLTRRTDRKSGEVQDDQDDGKNRRAEPEPTAEADSR